MAKSCESVWDEATRKTVKKVTGRSNAAMNTAVTPMREAYESADGNATSRA
jgi:hypothetical protein